MDSAAIIKNLALIPHPEGGWYREVYRSSLAVGTARGPRAAVTTIYYLLERHQLSRWHIVEADEIWHFYAGAPLELFTYAPAARQLTRRVLEAPTVVGSEPVSVVPAGTWQAAQSLGDYSLLGCCVGPGFEFADFRFVAATPAHESHFSAALQHLRHLL